MAKKAKVSSAKNAQGEKNLVAKHGNTAYVSIDPATVVKYDRAGNDLVIHQKNGKTIRIRDFFTTDDTQKLDLVYRYDGKEWPVKAVKATIPLDDATGSEVEFVAVGSEQSGSINPLAIAALAAGGIALAASGGGGGGGGGGGTEAPPPAAPGLNTKSNPDGTVTATGTAPAGSRVTVTFPDGTSKIVTTGADGKYTATSATSQNSGQVNAVVTDNNGKTSVPAVKDYIDDVAPEKPDAISVMDEVGAVTGKIKANDITDDARPVMSGKAEPGSTVTVYDGTTKLGTANVDSAGNWTFRPATALAEGEHKITFTATDKAGNTSPATDALVFTVDTVAPPVPVLKEAIDSEGSIKGAIAASGVTDDTRPEFKGENAEAGTTIRFFDNGSEIGSTVVAADGTWSFTPEIGLQQGVHRITMLAQDKAGNKSEKSATFQFEVDTTPPAAPSITEVLDKTGQFTGNITNGKVTDETKPVLSGSGAEAGSTVKIYDKGILIGETMANANGTWSFTPTTDLTEGEHVFTVTATDKAGNEGVASSSWTINVDTTAPDVPTIKQVTNTAGEELPLDVVTSERRPTLSGEAEKGSTVTIYDNNRLIGTITAADDGTWSFELTQNLAQGEHKFTIKATDAAGNETAGTDPFTLTVDSIAPNRPEISSITDAVGDITGNLAANAVTDDPRPTLSGKAEAGSTVTIYDQGEEIGTVTADANGLWTYMPESNLAEGIHSFTVTATDIAGNVSTPSKAFIIHVDTIAPEAPHFTIGYDAVGPVIGEFTSGAFINDNRPKLSGSGAEANALVKIYQDGQLVGQVRADVTGQWSWKSATALSDATYEFTATVTDTAGNVSQSSDVFSVTIDTVPPAKPVIDDISDNVPPIVDTVSNGGFTNDTTPKLSGSGAEANGTIRIYDGTNLLGEVTANETGHWSFTPADALGNGQHSFTVVAVDKAGNVSPRSDAYNITVDTLAPSAPSITQVMDDVGSLTGPVGNGKPTDATKPAISGSGAEAGSTVKIYDKGILIGETMANANGTWSFTPATDLTEGEHVFTVTATDKAGNEGVASASWTITVDTTAPEKPTITEVQNAAGGELAPDVITSERRPTLTGEAEKGTTVTIYDNGKKIGTVVADDDGTWSFEPKNNLAQGEHKFTIKATDAAGNESEASDPFTITVDSLAPDRPEILSVTDDVGPITGPVKANGITDDARPTLNGKAEAGSVVTIYDQGEEIGTVTADANGTWSFTPNADLEDGAHSFTVTATDAAGNVSISSKAFSIIVDTTPPEAPRFTIGYDAVGPVIGEFSDGAVINDNRPRLSGSGAEANSSVHIYQNGTLVATIKADAGGQWNWKSPANLADGTYSFTAKVEDAAGNVSAASDPFTMTIDTVAPDAPQILKLVNDQEATPSDIDNNGYTNDPTPVIIGGGAEANGTVRIYDGATLIGEVIADATGAWSFTPVNMLGNGLHTFTAMSVDAAGNVSPRSNTFKITVDTLAPSAPSITQVMDDVGSVQGPVGNGKPTDDTKPTISGSGAESGSTVKIYDNGVLIGSTKANANGTWSFTPTTDLAEGVHTFTATATDLAGNESSASTPWSVEVDITPPDAKFVPVITSATDDVLPNTGEVLNNGFTNDTTPRLNGTGAEPDGFIRIYSGGKLLGQVQADANGNWSFDVPVRPEGVHSFIATTVDLAGNEGSSSQAFTLTVDTTAPSSTDAVITSVMDAVEPHTGNIDSGGITNDARPVVSGTAANDVVLVRVYDGTTLLGEVEVTGGAWSFTPDSDLANGAHTFRVKAVDAAGNEGPFSTSWRINVDTLAPNAPSITSVHDDVGAIQGNVADGKSTDDLRPTISGGGAEAGSTVKIYDNGVLIGSTKANPNGTWSFTPDSDLTESTHSFTVTATDAAGNESAQSGSWRIKIDLSVPVKPTIDQIWDDAQPGIGPVPKGGTTNDTTPTLSGTAAPGNIIKIFINGTYVGETVVQATGQWNFTGFVSDGTHSFTVQSVNEIGTSSPMSDPFAIIVSTAVPGTPSITSVYDDVGSITGNVGNGKSTDDVRPDIHGKADANAKVNIYDNGAIIGQATADADGNWTFTPTTDLTEGNHSFTAKIIDGAGVEGQPSFPFTIIVDTTPPEAPRFTIGYDAVGPVIGEFSDGAVINDNRPRLSGSGAEANSSVHIYQNGTLVATIKADAGGQWNWKSPANLADGTYSFTAKVEDAAGNVSAASDPFTMTIDTVAPDAPQILKLVNDQEATPSDIDNNGYTNDPTPVIIGGGAEANGTVRIYDGATLIGEVIADATGAWSFTPVNMLGNGLHTFTAMSVDAAGNVSPRSNTFKITVDTLAPSAPSITQVMDDVGSVQGPVGNGKPTDDTKPTISGSGAESGSTVKIYDNGVLIGSTKANANGTWSFTPTTDLAEGVHTFTATATDLAGNESSASTPWSVEVDITPPDAKFVPVITSATDDVLPNTGEVLNNGSTNDTTPRLNGTGAEPDGFIRIYSGGKLLGQVQADANGNWSFDVPVRPEGVHSFIATTVDLAGNEGSSSQAFTLTVDTTAPSSTDAVITSVMDAVEPHTGNIDSGGITNDARPVVSGTAANDVVLVRVYDGTTLLGEVEVTGGAWSFTPDSDLANGAHTFRVKAVDAAGNEGPFSTSWRINVDTLAPNAPSITSVHDDVGAIQGNVADGKSTDDLRPTISGGGAEAGSTVKIYDNGVLIGSTKANPNGTWSFTPDSDLTESTHSFTVTATDAAGNESAQSGSWRIKIDLSVPVKPTIDQIWDDAQPGIGPVPKGGTTNDTTPTLSGTAAPGNIIKIFINGTYVGETVVQATGQWNFTGFVSDGTHSFTVQSVNEIGTSSPMSDPFAIIVSTAVPGTPSITSVYDDVGSITGNVGNGKSTDDVRPDIHGKADANAKVNIYDNGAIIGQATADADGNWTFTPTTDLTEGNHSFTAKIIDGAGVEGQPSFPFTIIVDTTPPEAPRFTIGYDAVGPVIGEFSDGAVINDNRPRLSGSGAEANSSVHIYQNGTLVATIKADAGGQWNWKSPANLADGTYSFTAKVEDAAGNVSAASDPFTMTIDTVAPDAPQILKLVNDQEATPSDIDNNGYTNDPTPVIIGGGAEANGTVRIYDGATLIGEVIADATGAWSFTPVNMLGNGLHTFTAMSVDAAGNVSPRSNTFKITVDTLAPSAPSITQVMDDVGSVQGPVGNGKPTDDTKPTISGSGAESGSTVKIYDNGVLIGSTKANANGTWSFTPTTDLAEGVHTFTATATDLAGNESSASTPWSVEVDITPPDAKFVPVITSATDDVLPNTGEVLNNGFTNDTTPRLNGTGAEPDGFIRIYSGGKLLGQVQADANGNWSFDVPVRPEGVHSFIATTVDLAGNEGSSSQAFTLTVDTTAPSSTDAVITSVMDAVEPHTGNIDSGGITNDARPVVSGTAANDVVLVRVYDGTTLLGEVEVTGGAWSFTPDSDLANGAHTFRVKAVDAAGNEGPFSTSWRINVDTLAPNAPSITSVHDDVGAIQGNVADGKSTDDLRPTISGGGAEAGSTVKIYDNGVLIGSTKANPNGTWSFTPDSDLTESTHSFTVTATDAAGNESAQSGSWRIKIDLSVPVKPTIDQIWDDAQPGIGPVPKGGTTNDTTPTLSGTAAPGNIIKIFINGTYVGETVVQATGQWNFTGFVSDGTHSFTVQSVNEIGTSSPMSDPFAIIVSTAVPGTPSITSVYDDVGSITGNVGNGKSTDDVRPDIHGKADANAKVNIYDNGAIIGQATADADGNWTFTPATDLTEGNHSFTAKIIDGAGVEGQPSFPFTIIVDTTPPEAPRFTIGYDAVGPVIGEFSDGAVINDNRPRLSGSGAEANSSVHIYQNGTLVATIKADAGGQWNWKSPANLADGTYSFTAKVEDAAGNVSAASDPFTMTIDTVAPDAPQILKLVNDQEATPSDIDNNGYTNDPTPVIIGGGAEANGTVRIYDGATLIGEVIADATGAWSFTPVNMLGNGLHTFTAMSVDAAGNVSPRSNTFKITVDTLAPSAPSITQVMDDVGSVQGPVGNGKPTDDTKPTISGSGAESGSTVKIYDNGVLIGSTKANANGTWSFTPTTDLAEGVHTFTATATDLAGNESSASTPWSVEVDITPPDAKFVPVITSATDDVLPNTGEVLNNGFTNDTTPRLNGTGAEPDGFIRIYSGGKLLGQVQADANGNWSFDVPVRPEGVHSFIATTVDLAGNEGSSSQAFTLTVDTTAPSSTDAVITSVMDAVEPHTGNIDSGGITNDARPVVSGTAANDVVLVRVYDGTTLLGEVEVTGGAWSFTPDSDLANGAHTFRVKAVDAAGNEGPFSTSWRINVDTLAPNAPSITSVHDDVGAIQGNVADGKSTDDLRPTISGGGAEAGSTVKIYDNGVLIGSTKANPNGTWSFTPDSDLTESTHSFTVTATDAAGNESAQSGSWRIKIDLSVPVKPTIDQIWDDAQPGIGPVPKGGTTNDTTPTLSGTAAPGNIIKIFINGTYVGETVVQATGQWNFTGFVSDGTHSFTVQSVNEIGTSSPMSDPFAIIVSTAVPGTPSITSVYDDVGSITGNVGNGKSTDDVRPDIHGKADANAKVNIYDNGAIIGQATADADGNWTFTPATDLTEGNHSFTAKIIDGAGVEGQPSFPFTIIVDTTPPEAPRFTIGYDAVGPVIGEFSDGAVINDNRPRLSGSGAEANSSVHIYQNGTLVATIKADAGGQWNWKSPANLADGTYSFTAKVEDAAGNVSAASDPFTMTIDTVAPDAPQILKLVNDQEATPSDIDNNGYTNDPTPVIIGGGAEANGTVRIYDGATLIGEVIADATGAWSFTPVNMLGNGLHTFTAMSVDAAGNVSPRSNTFKITVDTLAPSAPSITQVMDDVGSVQGPVGNGKPTDDTKPTISGSGAESGSTVKIYDNGVLIGSTKANANGTWSFTPTTDLAEGVHTFTATATDLAGNESGTSAPWSVTVDLTPPAKPEITSVFDDVAPGIGNVPNGTATNDPTPTLVGKGEIGSTIRVYDGTVFLGDTIVRPDGSWTFTTSFLSDGPHTFTAISMDEAGNMSPVSDSWTVTISTIPPDAPVITDLQNNNGTTPFSVANTGITNDQDPLIKGTAEPNMRIRIYDNGSLIGTVTADATGAWSFNLQQTGVKLEEGYHSLTAAAVNSLGFEGTPSYPRIVTIDITPPPAPVIVSASDTVGPILNPAMGSGSLTDDTMPAFRGTTDPYHVVKLYRADGVLIGETKADSVGNWIIQVTTPLDSAVHKFYATATDPAGNTSTMPSNIFTLTVDAIAPDAPKITKVIDNVPDLTGDISDNGLTNDPSPRVEGTGEAGATIKLYAGTTLVGTTTVNAQGSWSLKLTSVLPDGVHVLTATATDPAGNTGVASTGYTITVDTIAPNVPTITGVIDNVPAHTGEFGNRSTINDNMPKIVGVGEKGTTISVYNNGSYLGNTVVGADGKWTFQTPRALGDGTHKFTATATDPAGNTTVSSSVFEVTVDTIAPNAPTFDIARDNVTGADLASGGYTRDNRPTLKGKAEAYSTVEIVDAVYGVVGTVKADSSGNWQFRVPQLPDGVYNFKAKATDEAGNTSVTSSGSGYRITVDTVPPAKPVITDVIDAVEGGIVGTIPSNGLTNDARPTLKGTAEAGTTLTFYGGSSGTTVLGTMTVPANGQWSWTVPNSLSNGSNQLIVKSTDLAGNATSSTAWVILVDTVAPNAPTVTTVYDATEPAVGNITNGGYSNETKPLFSGTAEANSTLTVIMNNQEVTKITVGADGKWTWKPDTALADGKYDFNFKATDAAGNTSTSSSTFTVNVDTVAPDKPQITTINDNVNPITGEVVNNGYTNDPKARLTITGEANATVIIYDNGVQVGTVTLSSSGTANWTPTANIPEGKHTYTVKQVDRAGLESEISDSWTINVILTPPLAPTIVQVYDNSNMFIGPIPNGGLTNDPKPVISGTGVPGTTIQVNATSGSNNTFLGSVVVGADGKWTLTPVTTLSSYYKDYQITAKAVDLAGNISPVSSSWQISLDMSPPAGVGGRNMTPYFDDASDTMVIAGNINAGQIGMKVVLLRNGVALSTQDIGTDGKYSINIPRDPAGGWADYKIVFYSPAGNTEPLKNSYYNWSSVNGVSKDHVLDTYQTFHINSDKGLTAPKFTYLIDGVGAVQGFEYNNAVTDAKTMTLNGIAKYISGSTNTVTVYLDGTAVGTVNISSDGKWSLVVNNIPEGPHAFTATLTAGGKTSAPSADFNVTIDTVPPEAPIIDEVISDVGIYAGVVAKNGFTNDKTLELKGTTEPFATVRIYDGSTMIGEVKAGADGKWTYTTGNLSDGTHIFRTLGIDKAGNMGTLDLTTPGYSVTVDTQSPAPPVINTATDAVGPYKGDIPNNSVTDDKQPTLNGKAEPFSTVRIMAPDGKTILGTAVTDTNGNWSFKLPTALADGKYTFTAIAVDRAGNIGNASSGFAIEIDTTPPPAPVISRVQDTVLPKVGDLNSGDPTNDTRPSFSGTAEANGKVKVYLNGVEIGSADVSASGTWTYRPAADKAFAEGTHNLTFKAMDKAGNLSTTETTFKVVVDVTAPAKPELNQIIDAFGPETGPISNNGTTDDAQPTFKGKGEAGGLVTITDNGKVLGTTTVAADGTWTFKPTAAMTAEAHTITVTVSDAAGNVSVASDAWKFTIIRPAGGPATDDDGMQGFSADMPDTGDMHSFSARPVHDEPVQDEQNAPEAHAAPMSLDTSAFLAELDVPDGQWAPQQSEDNHALSAQQDGYDDHSVLAGLIDMAQLADQADDRSAFAEPDHAPVEFDMTALANEVFEQPDQTEAEEIDLSALPETPADPVLPSADTNAAGETTPAAAEVYTPPSTADLELDRLLQQTAAQF